MEEESVSMDQEVAKRLLLDGATLIILDLPEGTEFGIDLKSWHAGYKFRGVKMIPPGLHMFYYNISNKYGDMAPRASFIHNFKKSEIVVKKWNRDLEEISPEDPSEEELSRLKSNLFNLDQFLGPYPYEIWDKWKSLIKNVTDRLVNRVTPECGVIRSALDLVSDGQAKDISVPGTSTGISDLPSPAIPCRVFENGVASSDPPEKEREDISDKVKDDNRSTGVGSKSSGERMKRCRRKDLEDSLLPHLKPAPGTQLRFTEIPDDIFPEDSTPAQITKHSIDPTFTLETLLSSMESEKEYIGELELSFVCFLAGLSLDALEAWKRLVVLPCRCEEAVSQRPVFYSLLLSALHTQLQHIPEDFLVDIVESENAVYTSLRNIFRSTLTGDGINPRLRKIALAFSQKLSERFEWDFSNLDEDDEDEAPVVVDLDNNF